MDIPQPVHPDRKRPVAMAPIKNIQSTQPQAGPGQGHCYTHDLTPNRTLTLGTWPSFSSSKGPPSSNEVILSSPLPPNFHTFVGSLADLRGL